MKHPYDITIVGSKLPQVIINAPGIEARPRAWRTRIQWAWRCLRGKAIGLSPTVMLTGCMMESASMIGCNIETHGENVVNVVGGDAKPR